MKILHLSDTHGYHNTLQLGDTSSVDVLVFTGDESNHRDPIFNENEFFDFLEWFEKIEIENKLFIAGNHSSYIFHNEKRVRNIFKDKGIIYLNKESVTINGVKFYGDPTSPTFGDWVFQSNRGKMYKHWEIIPKDTDVLLTHTPPKGILDLTEGFNHELKQVGCTNLRKVVKELHGLKAHCFGHIHNSRSIKGNVGVLDIKGIKYSNAACVEDGMFNLGAQHHGNIITI